MVPSLGIDRGILVDDHLQTSRPGIYAIGECAEHRGVCYGLVEPAYEQARVLAAHLAGEEAHYPGSVLATNLKVSGVNVFSAGDFLGAPGTEQSCSPIQASTTYKKLVVLAVDWSARCCLAIPWTGSGISISSARAPRSRRSATDSMFAGAGRTKGGVMSSDFTPDQKRYLEGFASGLTRRALRAVEGVPAEVRPVSRPAPTRSTSRRRTGIGRGRQAGRSGKIQARAASVRCL